MLLCIFIFKQVCFNKEKEVFGGCSYILFHLVDENPVLSNQTGLYLNLCSASYLKGNLFKFSELFSEIKTSLVSTSSWCCEDMR